MCKKQQLPLKNQHRGFDIVRRVPVSTANSRVIYDALKAGGIRLMSALPETWLVHLIRMAEDDPEMTLVRLAKEEEGVGISAGAHLAGVKSAMLMQNHGFLASINGIVSGAQLYRIPLLMLISYRGEFGERDPWQTEGGGATEDLLRALRIPFLSLDTPGHVATRIRKAQTLAQSANRPVALLLCRDLMWEEDPAPASERSERVSGTEGAAKRRASDAVGKSQGRSPSDQ
jgi:sulfopyruvate decarboxylase subunit alpha